MCKTSLKYTGNTTSVCEKYTYFSISPTTSPFPHRTWLPDDPVTGGQRRSVTLGVVLNPPFFCFSPVHMGTEKGPPPTEHDDYKVLVSSDD